MAGVSLCFAACGSEGPSQPNDSLPPAHITGTIRVEGSPWVADVQLTQTWNTDSAADDVVIDATTSQSDGAYVLRSDSIGCSSFTGTYVDVAFDGVLDSSGNPTSWFDDQAVDYCQGIELDFDIELPAGYSVP
jgi:hypothetical protein